jgi:hypothetical protein
MSNDIEIQRGTPAYQFYLCFFSDRIPKEKPFPFSSYQQDRIFVLRFVNESKSLEMGINMGHLKDGIVPCGCIYCDTNESPDTVDMGGNLLDPQFRSKVNTFLDMM